MFQDEGERKQTGADTELGVAHTDLQSGRAVLSATVTGRNVLKEVSGVTRFPCERPLRQLADGGAAGKVAEVVAGRRPKGWQRSRVNRGRF